MRCGGRWLVAMLLLGGCGDATSVAELCAQRAERVDRPVVLSGAGAPGEYTVVNTTLALCGPSCCNEVLFAPAFSCPDGTLILVRPPPGRGSLRGEAEASDYQCLSMHDIVPTAACPLSPECERELPAHHTLRGTLRYGEVIVDGRESYFIEMADEADAP